MASTINLTLTQKRFVGYSTDQSLNSKEILLIFVLSVVFIIGTTGNLLICYIFKFKNNRVCLTIMERLILYLAITDFFASFVNPIMFAYWTVTRHSAWHFGELLCKVLPSLTRITVSLSIGIILVITIDRCHVICNPFHRQYTKLQINLLIAFTVLLSIGFDLPHIIHHRIGPSETCIVQSTRDTKFAYPAVALLIFRDFLFILTFSVTVSLIYKQLYNAKHKRALKEQNHYIKSKRIVFMLLVMAVLFIVMVFPRDLFQLVFLITWLRPPGITFNKTLMEINSFLKVLHMCNSLCNIFVYARLHDKFRRRLLRLTKKFLRKQSYGMNRNVYNRNNRRRVSSGYSDSLYRTSRASTQTSILLNPLMERAPEDAPDVVITNIKSCPKYMDNNGSYDKETIL